MLDQKQTYMSGGKVVYGYELNATRGLNNAVIAMLERKHKEAKVSKKTPPCSETR